MKLFAIFYAASHAISPLLMSRPNALRQLAPRVVWIAVVGVSVAITGNTAAPQVTTVTITGTVYDSNGAVVPNALVIVVSPAPTEYLKACSDVSATAAPSLSPPVGFVATPVHSNALGQYTFDEVAPGATATVIALRNMYGCGAVPNSIDSSREVFDHQDIQLPAPLVVTIRSDEAHSPPALTVTNRTNRNVDFVYWPYNCHNVDWCNAANSQTQPADDQSRTSRYIQPAEQNVQFQLIRHMPHGPHADFSADTSYCYVTAVDTTGLSSDFDVVSWPSAPPGACRHILADQADFDTDF